MSEKGRGEASENILEEIDRVAREFRKQISRGKSPRIEKYLSQLNQVGRKNLFDNLLGIEVAYRRSQGESPTSSEYIKRFPQYSQQVRRAFFEATMDSVDSASSADAEGHGELDGKQSLNADDLAPTYELPEINHLGDYELIREIGRGGMGIVYEARHTTTNNRVALKTLPSGGHDQQVNADKLYRFRKEFRRLSEINHPNLVGMQSLEVDGDRWFFTMDLIDGQEFLDHVRSDGMLHEEKLRTCLKQLAAGVMELHRQGIIHRDLKPSNVLVSSDGHITILDFGLAAQLQRSGDVTQSKSGMFAGTPPYAAPEQMFGERTEASDWYAFGTILFEALVGQRPFQDPDPMSLLRMKHEQDPPQLMDRDDLPDDLSALTDGLLRREPGLRLASNAIGDALGLTEDTLAPGSTRDSQGSTGSLDAEEAELGESEEDEILLIGRELQLAQLEQIKLDFLREHNPKVVWISGLSGEGKSSLVAKFLHPIRRGDEMLVLSGRCYDRESVPFKVIDSIIDPLVRFLRLRPIDELRELLPADIVALTHLFPVLRRIKAVSESSNRQLNGLDDKQIHSLAFNALKALLKNIGKEFPLVIFVDDLQWGDADSADVIFDLLSSGAAPPVLLIGSYRRDEIGESPFWTNWEVRRQALPNAIPDSKVEVQPLSPRQAVELLALRTGISEDEIKQQASALIADTHGNPYFLEQLIEGMDKSTGTFRAVPLDEVIAVKLSRLPSQATALLDAIAAAGKAVSLIEASEVCDLKSDTIGTIAHMRSERLVRLVGSGYEQFVDTYHDKIREARLAGLSNQRKRELHNKFGCWIEQQYANADGVESGDHPRAADLAYHFSKAEHAEKAFQYSLHAGRQAMTAFAFSDAMGFLNQAHSLEPKNVDVDSCFSLHLLLGKALFGLGRLDQCIDQLQIASEHAIAKSDRALSYVAIAEALYQKGDYFSAVETYHSAFAALGEKVPKTVFGKLLRSSVNLVSIHLVPGALLRLSIRKGPEQLRQITRLYDSFSDSAGHLNVWSLVDSLTRACIVAKTLDDPEEKCSSSAYYSFLMALAGVPILPQLVMNKCKQLEGKLQTFPLMGSYHYSCSGFFYAIGKLAQAELESSEAAKFFGKVGDFRLFMAYHFARHIWSIRGNVSRIEYFATNEFALAARSNDEITMAYGFYGLADALSRKGQFEAGVNAGRRAVEFLEKWNATFKGVAYQELGRAQLQASQYDEARATLSKAVEILVKFRFFEIGTFSIPLLAEAILGPAWHLADRMISSKDMRRTGRLARSARWASRLFPNLRGHAFRASGRFATCKAKPKKAIKYFDRAINASEKIGADYDRARTLIDKSFLDYPDAPADRQRGLDLLESLGCVLPDAEIEYLNIDRDSHHARAATARANDAAEHDLPEFDLAAWEAEHGPMGNVNRDQE